MAAEPEQTIETIWTELESGLNSIYKKQDRVSPIRYMELYTYVLEFLLFARTSATYMNIREV